MLLGPMSSGVLVASGLVNICSYGAILIAELKRTPAGFSPILGYYIASFLRLGIAPLWISAVYSHGDYSELKLGEFSLHNVMLFGQFLLVVGDWILISAYALFDRKGGVNFALTNQAHTRESRSNLKAIAVLLSIGWSLKIADIMGFSFVRSSVVPSLLATVLPPTAVYLLLVHGDSVVRSQRMGWRIVAFILTIIDVVLGMRSYMKSGVLIAVLPAFLYGFSRMRNEWSPGHTQLLARRFLPIATGVLVIGLVLFPFNQIRRTRGLDLDSTENQLFIDIMSALEAAVPGTRQFERMHRFPRSGFWGLIGRHAIGISASWSYQYVTQDSHLKGELIWDEIVSLIPRPLWKDKPTYSPGHKITVLLGMASTKEEATTATDAGSMAGGLFLNFGWIGVLVGMIANGFLLAVASKLGLKTMKTNPAAAALCMMLYIQALKHYESATGGNISMYAVAFGLFLPAIILWERVIPSIRKPVSSGLSMTQRLGATSKQ